MVEVIQSGCKLYLQHLLYVKTTESTPVANTRRFTNARKNECSSLVKLP